jgi:hypothetical protein
VRGEWGAYVQVTRITQRELLKLQPFGDPWWRILNNLAKVKHGLGKSTGITQTPKDSWGGVCG